MPPALNFPATPALNDKHPQPPVAGQPIYTWDGAKWTTGDTSYQAAGEPSNAIPRMDADPAQVGTSVDYARGDHRHPVDLSRAPVADPNFIGMPTAPTPPTGNNSERLATTAFVSNAVFVTGNTLPSNSDPLMNGTAAAGTSILFSREDHVHPVDNSRAPLHGPVFTGVPEADTPPPGSNTTRLATTAFVTDAIAVVGGVSPSAVTPLVESGAGAIGVSVAYARADHVHPAAPVPAPATVAPVMDSVAAVGASLKYAKEDHVHPSDVTKAGQTAMEAALADKSDTGHTHSVASISGFSEAVDDRVSSLLVPGTNITLDYDDVANTLTVTAAGGAGGGSGDVTGPVSAVDVNLAVFNGATGKVIKDGGVAVSGLQPKDAELTAIAGLASAADSVPYFTGSGTAALTTLTGFGRSLIDDADAAAAKTTLGLTGAALTLTNDTNVTLTAGGSLATSLLAASSVTAGWTGTLSSARGGLGVNAGSQSGVPLFATGVATFTGTSGTGNFVRVDGPTFTGDPRAPTPTAGDNDTTLATTAFVTAAVANAVSTPFDAMAFNGLQINGNMEISQEKGTTATTASGYVLDGWQLIKSGTMVTSTLQTTSLVAGINNAITMNITTAKATLGAAEHATITQPIEGYRVARLAFGTASAKPITLAFWTWHNRTGVYSGSIRNGAGNRSYTFTYTQAASGVAQYNTVTIPGDTSGTWTTDNTAGMYLTFSNGSGATFMSPADNAWGAGNFYASASQVNGCGATSDSFRITGVIALPGSQAPTAAQSINVMRSLDQELETCQRYYFKKTCVGTVGEVISIMQVLAATIVFGKAFDLPVTMRATPTSAVSSLAHLKIYSADGTSTWAITSGSFDQPSVNAIATNQMTATGATLTPGDASALFFGTSTGWISASARL